MEHVHASSYNGKNLTNLVTVASAGLSSPNDLNPLHSSARSLLETLQNSTARLADFEFFEQIQQIPLSFPHGTSTVFIGLNDYYQTYFSFICIYFRCFCARPSLFHSVSSSIIVVLGFRYFCPRTFFSKLLTVF